MNTVSGYATPGFTGIEVLFRLAEQGSAVTMLASRLYLIH